jgi:hypothetical protein
MATKGKWVIVRDTDGRPESIRVMSWEDNDLMGDYKGCIIADLTASHGNRSHAIKEVEENAKLMVAAKDLLWSLEMMVIWAEKTVQPQLGDESLPRGFEKAKEAIKSAAE